MSVIGIVGEYNPFHYGHKHHISETKRIIGEDAPVVCVMSGDYVQRGEPAMYSKFARAEAAVKGGADLILELPVAWTLSSAEGFARGAAGLLDATGVVTHLSFGSELGDPEPLCRLAELMLDPSFTDDIRTQLGRDEGIQFALARQRAAECRVGRQAELLTMPNSILAVEYIKYIYAHSSAMKPVTVMRYGAGHDSQASHGPQSASEIRAAICRGENIKDLVPESTLEILERENSLGRGPVTMEALEPAILSRLRMLPDSAFALLPDAAEGLENRLARAAREGCSIEEVLTAAKSKRYPLSRIRRMTMCAAIGIKAGDADGIPPYARVLAANGRGCTLLKDMNTRSSVPIITKPAAVKSMNDECRRVFDRCSAAHDLFSLGYSTKEERKGGADWRTSPKIVQDK